MTIALPTLAYGCETWTKEIIIKAAEQAWYRGLKSLLGWRGSLAHEAITLALGIPTSGPCHPGTTHARDNGGVDPGSRRPAKERSGRPGALEGDHKSVIRGSSAGWTWEARHGWNRGDGRKTMPRPKLRQGGAGWVEATGGPTNLSRSVYSVYILSSFSSTASNCR